MKIARYGSEYCILNEENLDQYTGQRMHLIKMAFANPTEKLIHTVFKLYPETNRFFVSKDVRFYNGVLKVTNKKYYVENNKGDGIISFFKRNNKCLLNFEQLLEVEKEFIFSNLMYDVLANVEVIALSEQDFKDRMHVLEEWPGNIVIL